MDEKNSESVAREMPVREAVPRAVDECIWENILREFLRKNRAEVQRMSIYEFDEEAYLQGERDTAYESGIAKGIEQGIAAERIHTEQERKRAEDALVKLRQMEELVERLRRQIPE